MEKLIIPTDEVLIKSYLNGNETSLTHLIERYQGKLFAFILKRIKNRELANDLFQEVFVKVVIGLKANKYAEDGKFGAWLLRIAHNIIIDHFRRAKKNREIIPNFDNLILNTTQPELEHNIEDKLITASTFVELGNLMHLLPPSQKEVIYLRFFCDMSFKEIAEETNVSVNTALGRMRYALSNLKRLIVEKKINLSAPTI